MLFGASTRMSAIAETWLRAERSLDSWFPAGTNPLANLGAIACLLFAILLVSGVYLFVVFNTSVTGAWSAIDALSRLQPFPGGWLRSLHRYAADAFLIVTLLHLLREGVLARYTRFRRMTWLTGLPLLLLMYISGIGGFWLNWDRLGQYSAIASAEMFDALPLLSGSMARNFLGVDSVSDRLFSLLIFVHLGVPLLLLFGLWFHLQRITRPAVLPPRALSIGVLLTLALLAALLPVMSQAPADLATVPSTLKLDWILLHLHPLAELLSPAVAWALIGGVLLLLLALPLRRERAQPVAVVDADNCNGCRRCVADCPYAAITLEAHPNGKAGRQIAVVAAERCASCGICAGSCPSATPFRSARELTTGIDMPQQPIGVLREQLESALAGTGRGRLVVFGCNHGADLSQLDDSRVARFSLLCIGLLPPSFVEYALRFGASGVIVAGCSTGGCAFRLGERWTAERLAGTREPQLRASVPRERLRMVYAGRGQEWQVAVAVEELRSVPATPAT
jgi:quinol-cytochrome oxidoreductase complex cytochrome b subunit/ferredoxin/coenzyme F420-reducing hydrogenase delta subunit